MRIIPATSLVLGSFLAIPAPAAEVQDWWLQRLYDAKGGQGFQGTFVYERNGNLSTLVSSLPLGDPIGDHLVSASAQ